MSFKEIKTQEELDAIIKKRLERVEKQFEGYLSPDEIQKLKDGYEEKLKDTSKFDGYTSPEELEKINKKHKDEISKLQSENSNLKLMSLKSNIAKKYNLPDEIASRLTGKDEGELERDAEELSKFVSVNNVLPLANQTTGEIKENDNREAMRKLVQNLEEGE